MNRERVEQGQVGIYLVAIGAGLGAGALPGPAAPVAEGLIWPALAALLYVTFLQVPMAAVGRALRGGRFLAVVLVGNFLLVPVLVWGLTAVLPLTPAVTVGILLVLLVPCTDWYLTFTHLTGGDTGAAIAVTPLNLLLQLALLPIYLWLFLGDTFGELLVAGPVLTAFGTLIGLPLALAYLTERLASHRLAVSRLRQRSGVLPVPLLALVMFLIAASQVSELAGVLPLVPVLTLMFGLFLIGALVLGWLLSRAARLPPAPARAAVLSLATRNSFVVLPLALALPEVWRTAAVVIVYQSLVELFGLVLLVHLLPRLLPGAGPRRHHAGSD